ncbi:MAG TPA: hypothetical protein VEU30_06015 [Thermoanaerobaculia bacterium]|nr:hypothetical protein [Thermoanaerobaculia bacterium]
MNHAPKFVLVAALLFVSHSALALNRLAEKQLVNHSSEDTEPAIISYRFSGVDYNCAVWMNFNPTVGGNPTSKLQYTAWASNGSSVTGFIPDIASGARHADPVLVRDPAQAHRLYLVGLVVNEGLFSVMVWTSSDGGVSWTSPAVVSSSTSPRLDKPVAAMGPLGKLWISWVRSTTFASELRLRSGTRSGSNWVWGTERLVSAGTNQPRHTVHGPQLMVESSTVAYVLYTDYDNGTNYGRIGLIRYDDSNATFTKLNDATNDTSAETIYTGVRDDDYLQMGTVRLLAGTVPSARLDQFRSRIVVTWHERNGALRSRIRFASYETDTFDPTRNWTVLTIGTSGGHDVLPALEVDFDTGRVLVAWYAFWYNQPRYSNVGRIINFATNTPQVGAQDDITLRQGNITSLSDIAGQPGDKILGDYHEVGYSNGSFKVAQIIVAPTSDPWTFTVQSQYP